MSAETYGPELTAWPAREEMPDGSVWILRNRHGDEFRCRARNGALSIIGFTRVFAAILNGDTLRRVYPAGAEAVSPVDEKDIFKVLHNVWATGGDGESEEDVIDRQAAALLARFNITRRA